MPQFAWIFVVSTLSSKGRMWSMYKGLLFIREERLQFFAFNKRRFQCLCNWLALSPPGSYGSRIHRAKFPCLGLLHSPVQCCLIYGNLIACLEAHFPLMFHNGEICLHRILFIRQLLAQ